MVVVGPTFQVKLWLALAPWPSLAVTDAEYVCGEPVIVPLISPVPGIDRKPGGQAGGRIAPRVAAGQSAVLNLQRNRRADERCSASQDCVTDSSETFQVKSWVALAPVAVAGRHRRGVRCWPNR